MNENDTAAVFHHEGEPAFPESEDTGEETPAASQAEDDNQEGGDPSQGGEQKESPAEKPQDIPFHEHPRWKEREEEWNTRFNDQEQRHQQELKEAIESIRQEFSGARKDNKENTEIPSWFGGTQEQWDAYRKDRDQELKDAEERAIERITKESKDKTDAQTKAVEEATEYFNKEVAAIEADKTLNPSGKPINKEKLLEIVVKRELIDTKGRWNYRAGMEILNGQKPAEAPTDTTKQTQEKKEVAAATTENDSGDANQKKDYVTSKDFEQERPW